MDVINIEKLKRVNLLAKTLNQHHLAVNQLEAANLAREINGGDSTEYLDHLKVNEKQQWEVGTSQNQRLVMEKPKLEEPQLRKEDIEAVMQEYCNFFCREIEMLNERVMLLTNSLEKLNNPPQQAPQEPIQSQMHVEHSESRVERQAMLNTEPENNENAFQQIVTSAPQRNPEPEVKPELKSVDGNNPRSGSYNSEDVSVEKFFYYGTK